MSFALSLLRNNPKSLWGKTWDLWPDDIFDGPLVEWKSEYVPACDVEETDTHCTLSLDMPGISKEDVNIEVDKSVLKVSGERKSDRKKDNDHYHWYERRQGKFERTFGLAEDMNADKIEATHENGVLKIAIEKAEKSKPTLIAVK